MAEKHELIRQIEKLQQVLESVDFGDLKNELGKCSNSAKQIQHLEQGLASVDFGDLKNELGSGTEQSRIIGQASSDLCPEMSKQP